MEGCLNSYLSRKQLKYTNLNIKQAWTIYEDSLPSELRALRSSHFGWQPFGLNIKVLHLTPAMVNIVN